MKVRSYIIAVVFMLVAPLILCAQNAALSNKRLNILTLGDSNGTFPHSWPKQLEAALPNATVFNISKSGRTIGFLNLGDSTLNSLMVIGGNLKKAAEATGNRPYDYVIIEMGTNDAKAIFADRQQEVAPNLAKLINAIQHSEYPVIHKAKIVIISPPPYGSKAEATEKYKGGGQRVQAMSWAFTKVARQNHCLFVNGYTTPGLDVETMTADGLHLDAAGSSKLIEPVVAVITR
jgi:acyl-CoA thioesterase-1